MKQRTAAAAMQAVNEATEAVIQSGIPSSRRKCGTPPKPRSTDYLADIISGKVEGPYKPTGGWRTRGR
jgi:hypothetical protein